MRFVRIPIVNLARRPMRTGLTILGVGMAVAAYVMMMGLARGLEHAWVGNIVERRTDVFVVRKGAIEVLSTSINEPVLNELRRQPEVAEATAELMDLVPTEGGDNTIVCGWPADSYMWDTLRLKDGRRPGPSQREVVIGNVLAESLGIRPGATVRLLDQDFSVVAISHESGTLMTGAVVMPLPVLQQLLNRENQVTAIHLRMAHRDDSAADVRGLAELSGRFPGLTFTRTGDVAATNQVVSLVRAISWIISAIGLLMGGVVLVNTLLMSVTERTREIGTLTALGWSGGWVMRMILLEALAVSALGGVVGVAAGAVGIRWLSHATVVRGFVQSNVSPGLMVETALATIVVGLAATVYPAWRATTLSTAAALRHE